MREKALPVIAAVLVALAVVVGFAHGQEKTNLSTLDAIRIEYQALVEENVQLRKQVAACREGEVARQGQQILADIRQQYGAGPNDQLIREIVDGKAVYRFVKAAEPRPAN